MVAAPSANCALTFSFSCPAARKVEIGRKIKKAELDGDIEAVGDGHVVT